MLAVGSLRLLCDVVYSLAPRVQLVQARAALDAALVPVALNGTHEDDLQGSNGQG